MTLERRILGAQPRAVLDNWRIRCSDQADTLLTGEAGSDLYEPLALLVERLLGMPRPEVQARLRDRWGLLIDLQNADMTGLLDADSLYARASKEYEGSEVWRRYQARRAQRQFPVLVQARNGRCSRCGLKLSIADSRKLTRGEPVLSACQHILFLSV